MLVMLMTEDKMRRLKTSALVSTLSHMINHWTLVIVLILMISMVFLVQLLLSDNLLGFVEENDKSGELIANTYVCSLFDARKDNVDYFISELQEYQDRIDEIIISAEVPLPKNAEITADSESFSSISSVTLVSFFPKISDRRIFTCSRGNWSSEDMAPGLFFNDELFNLLILEYNVCPDLLADTIFSLSIDGIQWNCTGIGSISSLPPSLQRGFAAVDYRLFFSYSETCDQVSIVFSSPPSEATLLQLDQLAERTLPVKNVFSSVSSDKNVPIELFSSIGQTVTVVFLLIINILSLFDYLLSLRTKEFQVYRLSGATISTIRGYALLELTIVTTLSVLIGGLVSLLPIRPRIGGIPFWDISPLFFMGNAMVLLLITWLGFLFRMMIEKGRTRFSCVNGGKI